MGDEAEGARMKMRCRNREDCKHQTKASFREGTRRHSPFFLCLILLINLSRKIIP